MIRHGGALDGVRILSPRTVALMTTNQVGTLHSPTGLGFGLGFETIDRYGANGLDSVGAFGWARRVRHDLSGRSGGASGDRVLMMQMLPNTTDIRDASSRRSSTRRWWSRRPGGQTSSAISVQTAPANRGLQTAPCCFRRLAL